MLRVLCISLCALSCTTFLGAQTTNIFGTNELTLNNQGVGLTSPIPLTFGIGTGMNMQFNALAASPVIVAVNTTSVPGAVPIGPGNSLDIPLNATFQIVLDGTGSFVPSWLSPFLSTNSAGFMQFIVPSVPLVGGVNFAIQSGFVNAAYPAGFHCSAAFVVSGPTPPVLGPSNTTCNPLAVNTGIICDDCFVTLPLGFNYTYYGTSYTEVHIGSNGYVTFGTGDSTFFETVSWFLSGPPRIAQCFDDHAPFNGGQIMFYTDNVATFEVCFVNVIEYFNNGPNTHNLTVSPMLITFDYDASMTINDCIVGLSPGGNLSLGNPINIGAGSNTLPANPAPYEIWDGFNTNFNLKGYQVNWVMNAMGVPVFQN